MSLAQVVVIEKKIYVGGGVAENDQDHLQVFQYDQFLDEWSYLPPCKVGLFAMAQFMGSLITVGGSIPGVGATGKLYCFKEESQKWEGFLKPMPTARVSFSVATTQSAIVASGGVTDVRDGGKAVSCATVEV